jgi:tetratricopeptide (TPR) repeat protein
MNLMRHGSLVGLLFSFAISAVAGQNCSDIEGQIEARLKNLAIAADELGAFRGLGEMALSGLESCPDSARLWYLAARSAEVLEIPLAGAVFSNYGGAKKIALDAAKHAPTSAPIATILARNDGQITSARRAHALNPDYRPASRALAVALLKESAIPEALKLVSVKNPSTSDRIVLARILLAAKRNRDALKEAKKALENFAAEPIEPTPFFEIQREGNEVLGLALLAEGRKKEALRALRLAAIAGSQQAQMVLKKLH